MVKVEATRTIGEEGSGDYPEAMYLANRSNIVYAGTQYEMVK